VRSLNSPGATCDGTSSFPWSSPNVLHLKNRMQAGSDWVYLLTGADEYERELLVKTMAGSAPFVKLDCSSLGEEDLQRVIFGSYHFTNNGQKIIVPGLEQQLGNGFLLLENLDCLRESMQLSLSCMVDSKEGWRLGSNFYETVPIRFKLIAAFDEQNFNKIIDHLYYRLGILTRMESLSKRSEDLVPILRHAIQDLSYVRDDLWVSDTFWEKLDSRIWPFSLGQWITGVTEFFSQNTSSTMTWSGFLSCLEFDMDNLMSRYDRLQTKHAFEKRSFLLDQIYNSTHREMLLKSLGVSWESLIEEVKDLGLSEDGELCRKLLTMPFADEIEDDEF